MTDNDSEVVETKLISSDKIDKKEKIEWLPRAYVFDSEVDKRITDLASQATQLDAQYNKIMRGLKGHTMKPREKKNMQKEKIQKSVELQQRVIEDLG